MLSAVFQCETYALVPVDTPLTISFVVNSPKELDVTEDIETEAAVLV